MVQDIPVKVFIRARPLKDKEKEDGCAESVKFLEDMSQVHTHLLLFKKNSKNIFKVNYV